MTLFNFPAMPCYFLLVPPAIHLTCALGNLPCLVSVHAFPAHLFPHQLPPVLTQYETVPADQHLDQHEMLAGGIGPDLAPVPVAEMQPATILAVRA